MKNLHTCALFAQASTTFGDPESYFLGVVVNMLDRPVSYQTLLNVLERYMPRLVAAKQIQRLLKDVYLVAETDDNQSSKP